MRVSQGIGQEKLLQMAKELVDNEYPKALNASRKLSESGVICNVIPHEWHISQCSIADKVQELLSHDWSDKVKENFEEILKSVVCDKQ